MAHNGGTPRLLAKCGSTVEILDKQQIEDPALARVKRARTTGHTDSLPAMAPHSFRLLTALSTAAPSESVTAQCGSDTALGDLVLAVEALGIDAEQHLDTVAWERVGRDI
jgi:hypothetical protein